MILGPDERPIYSTDHLAISENQNAWESFYSTTLRDPNLERGWKYSDDGTRLIGLEMSRTETRRLARVMYYMNPLLGGAADICASMLVGDKLTYGEVADRTARIALEEFFSENHLGTLIADRWIREFLTDGEQCTVFNNVNRNKDEPSKIAFLDVDGSFELESDTTLGANAFDMVYRVSSQQTAGKKAKVWKQGEFVWTALGMYNDPRGWPVLGRACESALSYIAMLNNRVTVHQMQTRILGVYKVFVNTSAADGGVSAWNAAMSRFAGNVPRQGGILTLATDPKTGISESLDFLKPASGASDAATDARNLLRLVGMTLGGLPEHWLGEGGNATRSTAEAMSGPALRLAQWRQNTIRGYLDRLMAAELKRRFGPDKLYTIKYSDVSANGLDKIIRVKKVKADRIEFPWVLPDLGEHSLQDALNRATVASQLGIASPQTLAGSIGFDPAEEVERMAAVGLKFGYPNGIKPSPQDTAGKIPQGGQNTKTTPSGSAPKVNPNGASDPTKDRNGQPTLAK